MKIVDYMERYGHEQLCVFTDPEVGLRAFVAIHDTTLGPALGGIRVWKHATEEEAVLDVLRLARAMTYKSAAAGLYLGGGKALIWADPHREKTEAMFRAFGRFVDSLGGRYIATEDVGTVLDDLVHMGQETEYVTGLPLSHGGSGDPSVMTGLGVYQAMRACVQEALGADSLKGVRVAVQGYGKVARHLIGHLKEAGTCITVTDIYPPARQAAAEAGLEVLDDPERIYDVDCDVFAPCALGGVLNSKTIPRLKCKVVCGGANNQLQDNDAAHALKERGILYAPDYIANAGGVINVSFEVGRPYDPDAAREKTLRIRDTMEEVIARSKKGDMTTAEAADQLAEERIKRMRRARPIYR